MHINNWVGKHVVAKDPIWGTYIGELVKVEGQMAKVKICAVRKCPSQGNANHPHWLSYWETRKPFLYGDIYDFGVPAIEAYEDEVPPYLNSLVASMDRDIESFFNMKRWIEKNLEEYSRQKEELVAKVL